MYKDLLAHLDKSPLLMLPLAALFLFLGVFVAVTVRVMLRQRGDLDVHASLPLHDDEPELEMPR